MKASYPALESAIEKVAVIIALFSTLFLVYPETTVLASGLQTQNGETAQVFELNSKQNTELVTIQAVPKSITIGDIVTTNDLLAPSLKQYLQSKGSPIAAFADEIPAKYNNYKRVIAISFVESNMCKRTPKIRTKHGSVESHNCSGIGGGSRVYGSYEEWFADMNNLLNKPNYASRPLEKFLGYYVVPGSKNWLNGVKKVEGDIAYLENNAAQQLAAMKNDPSLSIATAGTPELVNK